MTKRYAHATDDPLKEAVHMLDIAADQQKMGTIWALSLEPREYVYTKSAQKAPNVNENTVSHDFS